MRHALSLLLFVLLAVAGALFFLTTETEEQPPDPLERRFAEIDRRIDEAMPLDRGRAAPAAPEERQAIRIRLRRRGLDRPGEEPFTRIDIDDTHHFTLPPGWRGRRTESSGLSGEATERVRRYDEVVAQIDAVVMAKRRAHGNDVRGVIAGDRHVRHTEVMAMLDVFLRADIQDVVFDGPAPEIVRRDGG